MTLLAADTHYDCLQTTLSTTLLYKRISCTEQAVVWLAACWEQTLLNAITVLDLHTAIRKSASINACSIQHASKCFSALA